MIPVNIRMFDIEADSEAKVERIKFDRQVSKYINDSYNDEIYVLNNDEILITKITLNRNYVKNIIEELYKLSTEFEIKTEDELIKMYDLRFKYFVKPIGEFNLNNKKIFNKTKNYIMPKNINFNLFYELLSFYCINGDEMLTVPTWLFQNLKAHYGHMLLENSVSNSIAIKYINNAKMELITNLYNKFNIEILKSFSCDELKETIKKIKIFKKIGILESEYEELIRVMYNAELNKTIFDKFDLKIEKEKQLKKHK